jgi:hypothetical protein
VYRFLTSLSLTLNDRRLNYVLLRLLKTLDRSFYNSWAADLSRLSLSRTKFNRIKATGKEFIQR